MRTIRIIRVLLLLRLRDHLDQQSVSWRFLEPKVEERLGRRPRDEGEASIVAEQVIAETARKNKKPAPNERV